MYKLQIISYHVVKKRNENRHTDSSGGVHQLVCICREQALVGSELLRSLMIGELLHGHRACARVLRKAEGGTQK